MPTFTGTAGNDTLTGGVGEDIVLGLDGNDTLSTGEVYLLPPAVPLPVTNVRDVVRGGDGNDVITADGISNGAMLYGDAGDDRITVGFSGVVETRRINSGGALSAAFYTAVDGEAVQIFGGTGNDTIRAFSHAIIDGGDGDDTITVGTSTTFLYFGAPVYSTSAGFDTTVRLTGGAGADVFVISNPVGTAIITDFEVGIDQLNLAASGVLNVPNLDGRIVLGRQGADTLLMSRDGGAVYARLLNVDPSALGASTFLANFRQTIQTPNVSAEYLNLAGPIFTVGTDGADTVQGVGATFYFGAGGNDVLRAGAGDSILNGDAGDDLLVGGVGADTLRGGAGADTLQGGEGADSLSGDAGIDILIGGAGADLLTGGAGLGDHFRYMAYADSNAASGYDTITDFQERYGTGGTADVIDLSGLVTSSVTLVRTGREGTLIFATTAEGTLQIASTQRIGGEDVLTNGIAGLTIFGSSAADIGELIIAGPGADTIYGQEGSDRLIGRQGADVLYGGAGTDRFVYWSAADSTAAASDVIMDFETGVDLIDFASESFATTSYNVGAVTIIRAGGSSYVFAASAAGNSQLVALGRDVNGADIYVNGSQAQNVSIVGSDAADVITGSSGDNAIRGGGGLDQLTGGAGADRFLFAAGDSTGTAIDSIADFQTGSDRIVLEGTVTGLSLVRVSSTATLIFADYASGPQTVIGVNGAIQAGDVVGASNQTIPANMVGSDGSDVLVGSSLGDTISGGAGDDLLTGGGGADVLFGGAGSDTFVYTAGTDSTEAAMDYLADFTSGSDRIDLAGILTGTLSIVRLGTASFIYAPTTGGTLAIGVGSAVQGFDVNTSADRSVFMLGSSGDDTLIGSVGFDRIVGGAGNDTLVSVKHSSPLNNTGDLLSGGTGADLFTYREAIFDHRVAIDDFETGVDRIGMVNARGITIIRQEDGSSQVSGYYRLNNIESTIAMTALGRDINGNDLDTSYGEGIAMRGSSRADILVGSARPDSVLAGAGNDTIVGGGGSDLLYGEGGADTFVYRAASDSTVAGGDVIADFVSGTDRIDLTAVRTGASDTYGIAYLNGSSFLFVDLGGNGTNDMLIQLAGTTLVASDIRWSASAGEMEPVAKAAGPEVLPVSYDVDGGWTGLASLHGDGMLFLADGALVSARGQDWYL